MAESNQVPGVFASVLIFIASAAAGFAFGETALLAIEPTLTRDGHLLTGAALAAERVGATGVATVTACLVFTSTLISLGSGFILAAMVMLLLARTGDTGARLMEASVGTSIVVGAVTTGLLGGVVPVWSYAVAQCVMVLVIYMKSNLNEMTTALLIIFITIYLSVIYGRMGVIVGLFAMGLTISALFALRKALTERMAREPKDCSTGRLLERMLLYSIAVAILGFLMGLGTGEGAERGGEAEMGSMLASVVWVGLLTAVLLGAALGTVAVVGLGPEGAGKVALGAAVASFFAMRAVLPECLKVGSRIGVGGMLGVATTVGLSLAAAHVAVKVEFRDRNAMWAVMGSVVLGIVLATQGLPSKATPLTPIELVTVILVALVAFFIGAPKSPFNTKVNLRGALLSGPTLIRGIGMETITAAPAPLGAGALGAAALGTAALGRLGTVGVTVAVLLALGKTLSSVAGKSQQATNQRRD